MAYDKEPATLVCNCIPNNCQSVVAGIIKRIAQ